LISTQKASKKKAATEDVQIAYHRHSRKSAWCCHSTSTKQTGLGLGYLPPARKTGEEGAEDEDRSETRSGQKRGLRGVEDGAKAKKRNERISHALTRLRVLCYWGRAGLDEYASSKLVPPATLKNCLNDTMCMYSESF
jgi:hypothetical protein